MPPGLMFCVWSVHLSEMRWGAGNFSRRLPGLLSTSHSSLFDPITTSLTYHYYSDDTQIHSSPPASSLQAEVFISRTPLAPIHSQEDGVTLLCGRVCPAYDLYILDFIFSWSWCGYRKHSALKTFPHVTLILAHCFDAHSWWFPAFFLFATSYLRFFYFKKHSTKMVSLLFVQRK